MGSRGHTDLLRQFGLSRNPFVDRTAEKTGPLDEVSLFVPSDLRHFQPSNTTYVFFGRRGSGKTTIRLMMQEVYQRHNAAARMDGRSRGHFVADLSRPGLLGTRLRAFQAAIGASDDAWDASFCEAWTTADLVDCIQSTVATSLAAEMTNPGNLEGADMVARLAQDPRAARQFLLLVHLYADSDAGSLQALRSQLLRPRISAAQAAGGVAILTGTSAGAAAVLYRNPALVEALASPVERVWEEVGDAAPLIAEHPRASLAVGVAVTAACAWVYSRRCRTKALARAAAVAAPVRVVKPRPSAELAALLSATFSDGDSAEVILGLCIGASAHQKLDQLTALLRTLGFEGLAVFGDCFDEVSMLDPVQYPTCMKCFAREACRNDLLNVGRIHFFFPDSRLALDLNTDRTLKEARFDRHHVRDLTWSRFQLEELAERRFLAAQLEAQRLAATAMGSGGGGAAAAGEAVVAAALSGNGGRPHTFGDLFRDVKPEDFSSFLSKLSTPRELMIMMTELLARMEAHPEGGVFKQDLEIATQKALEQAV